MYWYGRPPVWRWVVAGVLVVGAVFLEFRPVQSVLHPFTAEMVEAGSPPAIEWREVPEGLFQAPELVGMVATHRLAAGEPITRSDLTTLAAVPSGWWQLALEVSFPLVPGAAAQVVLTESAEPVPAVVVEMGPADSLRGLVAVMAVPDEHAPAVAEAVAARRYVVLSAAGG